MPPGLLLPSIADLGKGAKGPPEGAYLEQGLQPGGCPILGLECQPPRQRDIEFLAIKRIRWRDLENRNVLEHPLLVDRNAHHRQERPPEVAPTFRGSQGVVQL